MQQLYFHYWLLRVLLRASYSSSKNFFLLLKVFKILNIKINKIGAINAIPQFSMFNGIVPNTLFRGVYMIKMVNAIEVKEAYKRYLFRNNDLKLVLCVNDKKLYALVISNNIKANRAVVLANSNS